MPLPPFLSLCLSVCLLLPVSNSLFPPYSPLSLPLSFSLPVSVSVSIKSLSRPSLCGNAIRLFYDWSMLTLWSSCPLSGRLMPPHLPVDFLCTLIINLGQTQILCWKWDHLYKREKKHEQLFIYSFIYSFIHLSIHSFIIIVYCDYSLESLKITADWLRGTSFMDLFKYIFSVKKRIRQAIMLHCILSIMIYICFNILNFNNTIVWWW